AGPVCLCEGAAYHGDGRRIPIVSGREPAAPNEAHAHRLEVAVGHDLPVRVMVGAVQGRYALERDRPVADLAGQRQQSSRSRMLHSRQGADVVHDVTHEALDLLVLLVAEQWQRQLYRDHGRAVEAEVDAL